MKIMEVLSILSGAIDALSYMGYYDTEEMLALEEAEAELYKYVKEKEGLKNENKNVMCCVYGSLNLLRGMFFKFIDTSGE